MNTQPASVVDSHTPLSYIRTVRGRIWGRKGGGEIRVMLHKHIRPIHLRVDRPKYLSERNLMQNLVRHSGAKDHPVSPPRKDPFAVTRGFSFHYSVRTTFPVVMK